MSEQSTEQRRRLSSAIIAGVILAALVGIALHIRIALPYDQTFVDGWVAFRDTDAFYYLRHIENMVHNSLRSNVFDPYMLYPGGSAGLTRPFFGWLVAGMALIVGRGAPASETVQAVAAYMPAILGALTLIPVYFIGKELFNRWVGLLSAALVAILPGEFLHRSLLGFTDHHVAETLLSATAILFLIMAVKRARERGITFAHLRSRDWPAIRKPLIYTLLAGLFLGFYLLSWIGGLLLIFVIFAYLVIQFIVDHLRRVPTGYLAIVGVPLFLVALLMLLPVLGEGSRETAYRASLAIAVAGPVFMSGVSRLMAGKTLKPVYYPLAILGLAGIGAVVVYAADPSLLRYMLAQFRIFLPEGVRLTILEVHPLSLEIAWANFTTSFFISFVSLAMVVYLAVRERSAAATLFLVWSVVMLAAVLGQRRFGYYFAVNAALLTGYFSWRMLEAAGVRKLLARSRAVPEAVREFRKRKKKGRERKRDRASSQTGGLWARVVVVGIALFFLVFYPNIGPARALASSPHHIGGWLEDGWHSSMVWLRDNTPAPFDEPDFYYESYPSRAEFEYPETAYGIMSWWDYGYFIMQIGRRLPNANPGQAGAVQAARFFTAQNEAAATEQLTARDARYVVIDHTMAAPLAKFHAIVDWAALDKDEFYEVFYQPRADGRLEAVVLYYPAYYRSAVARLYNFDGRAVPATEAIVISYTESVSTEGIRFNRILEARSFSSYEEAEAYVAGQDSGNHAIGGVNPLASLVPLEELQAYQLVHGSEATVRIEGQDLSSVKIFEYVGSRGS